MARRCAADKPNDDQIHARLAERPRVVGTNAGPVAAHLGIDLSEYDARIRTFIPQYDLMLDSLAAALADALPRRRATIVDLGIGTGSVAARCLTAVPGASAIGIDEDEGMVAAARERLGPRLQFSPTVPKAS